MTGRPGRPSTSWPTRWWRWPPRTIRRLVVEELQVEVVLGGGIFETTDEGFSSRVEQGIKRVAPGVLLRALHAPPVVGAALLGLDVLGSGPEAEARLREGLAGTD